MKTKTRNRALPPVTLPQLTLMAAALIGLGACNSGGNSGNDPQVNTPVFPAATFIRANNGTDNVGNLDFINQDATVLSSFNSGANEGVSVDSAGHLYQAADISNSAVRTACVINKRMSGGTYSDQMDREISGANTGLVNPKGIAIAHQAGLLLVANFNGSQITVFGTTAAGNVAPLAVTALAVSPWDLVYDEAGDRLYVALTDGTVAVYDSYIANGMSAVAADRTITPADSEGAQISVNSHGIDYDADGDRLVVSDVGDAADPGDGALFVINDASTASGLVSVQRQLSGPATMLGNPVDIVLSGDVLRIAEKSNDAVLIYNDIFSGPSGDVAPDVSVTTSKPESLVELVNGVDHADVSDSVMPELISGVAASSNPSGAGPTSAEVRRFDTDLSALASFDSAVGLESVTFDLSGDAYATFDDGVNGGIMVANRVATGRDTESYTDSRDRQIMGAATGLIAPKGLDVSTRNGLILVAENNAAAPGVMVFSSCATGNVSPLITLKTNGNIAPWDVDYDEVSDTAYVSLTNGTVAVFENLVAQMDSGATELNGENRLITPAISGVAVAVPTNLHGIDYDPASGALLVTDVGDAASATDGKLYVINNANSADGLVDIDVNIAGPGSLLGNPVDLMFDGSSVYLAEKSNSLILRFDNVLNSAGGDVVADASVSFTAAESVALIPQYLSSQPGQ